MFIFKTAICVQSGNGKTQTETEYDFFDKILY